MVQRLSVRDDQSHTSSPHQRLADLRTYLIQGLKADLGATEVAFWRSSGVRRVFLGSYLIRSDNFDQITSLRQRRHLDYMCTLLATGIEKSY